MGFGWKPSEHVFLTVSALARKHLIQAHPFTIASAAPEHEQEHAWFNLVIRAMDGFTRDLVTYAKSHETVTIRLDGPYGSSHAIDMLRTCDNAVLVAGGSGIAVAYPMLWSLLHRTTDVESMRSKQNVTLIWIVNQADHVDWIGTSRLDELKELGLNAILPPPTAEAGRPDVGVLVRDALDGLATVNPGPASTGVVISGPDGMNRVARNACAQMAWEGRDVKVSVEKFGW